MNLQEVEAVFDQHWKPGWGSISAPELLYVQDLIAHHAPVDFLEIGMASGLSGGLIARLLEERGGGTFTSLDHDNTFFGDPTKENGFLIEAIYAGEKVAVEKLPFKTSLDIAAIGRQYDMAFIDANHQHPWPVLDTLCLFPFLKGGKVVIHHDLNLYGKQDVVYGIGPKYLFDQFPESHRDRGEGSADNIFSLDLNISSAALEDIAISALYLPWSLRTPLSEAQLQAFREALERHYSQRLLAAFEETVGRFNHRQPSAPEPATVAAQAHSPSWFSRLFR